MNEKTYCYNCNKMVSYLETKNKKEYKINGEYFECDERVFNCSVCGNEVEIPEYDEIKNIYNEYLKLYGLTFDDFKNIRNNYNLSQDLFAKLMGWGKKTINRYENGQSFPQKPYIDIYSKLKKDKNYILTILNDNKERLKDDYYLILKKCNLYSYMKTINCFIYILMDNPLYNTALMKNMFAIDFQSNKLYEKTITNLLYAKATYGPVIDNRDMVINYLIKNDYIKINFEEENKSLFFTDCVYDDNYFSSDEISVMKFVKDKLKGKTSKRLSDWSHEFEGWKQTPVGSIISFEKYRNDFNIDIV